MKEQASPADLEKIELRPDGWDRFKSAVHAAAKSGPKHRAPKESAVKPSVVVGDKRKV